LASAEEARRERAEGMKAFIYQGGWDGHTPRETSALMAADLEKEGVKVTIEDHLKTLLDKERLATFDLIVPFWTMSPPDQITHEMVGNLSEAVKAGAGLAGVHGGMGDSVRHSHSYLWMTGGQFLDHPFTGDYVVRVVDHGHPATAPMPKAFRYKSEQYYMAVDPAIKVLAVTDYAFQGEIVEMPVIWHRLWGKGRVFYSALGHVHQEFLDFPAVRDMTLRGMMWAIRRKG